MNTGILSMQRVKNYGSFLQALSLKSILEEYGNRVEFIDIKPGELVTGKSLCGGYKKEYSEELKQFREEKNYIIDSFGEKYLNLSKEMNYRNDYDFAIIGSDEIFNCIDNGQYGFNTQIFGEDVSRYTITYAASCGHNSANNIFEYNLQGKTKQALKNLKAISVRDKNTYEFVKKISDIDPLENLDPVFISNYDKYLNKQFNKKDYIAIYSYDDRINNEEEINQIKLFAKKNSLKTIGVGCYQKWCDENIALSPFEVLDYFKNATYIITDTFHGTVFSIKYNKQFAIIIRSSNRNKVSDLLTKFNLESSIISHENTINDILNKNIDYGEINQLIKLETIKSKEYIKKELYKATI